MYSPLFLSKLDTLMKNAYDIRLYSLFLLLDVGVVVSSINHCFLFYDLAEFDLLFLYSIHTKKFGSFCRYARYHSTGVFCP